MLCCSIAEPPKLRFLESLHEFQIIPLASFQVAFLSVYFIELIGLPGYNRWELQPILLGAIPPLFLIMRIKIWI